jgi:hypothetical protein
MLGNVIRNILMGNGYFLSFASNDNEVRDLLHKLRPYETDKELIRIGGEGDGGYLVPNDLTGIEYCFSPGVARTASFESDLAGRGIRSFLADYSVDAPPIASDMFTFEKKYLGAVNNDIYMTLETWVEKSLPGYRGDLLLQMDIEGSEYDVMLETSAQFWKKFRIVVVEFHGLHTMFNKYGLKSFRYCFQKLLDHFDIVHIHPNNGTNTVRKGDLQIPGVMEITFLRKDRIQSRKPRNVFPHALDQPNIPGKPELNLPDCWYRD